MYFFYRISYIQNKDETEIETQKITLGFPNIAEFYRFTSSPTLKRPNLSWFVLTAH